MEERKYKVFPWWKGYILSRLGWLRKKVQNPEKILKDYIKEGMTVCDIGCGMGYFSIPMAEMVGRNGRVVAVDLQKQMLDGLRRVAEKQNKEDVITLIHCSENTLGLNEWNGKIDFMLLFAVVHEVPDRQRLFKEAAISMKKGAKMLIAEPQAHVSRECFEESVCLAKDCGLKLIDSIKINMSQAVLLEK